MNISTIAHSALVSDYFHQVQKIHTINYPAPNLKHLSPSLILVHEKKKYLKLLTACVMSYREEDGLDFAT